jgi:hypothetical protein
MNAADELQLTAEQRDHFERVHELHVHDPAAAIELHDHDHRQFPTLWAHEHGDNRHEH